MVQFRWISTSLFAMLALLFTAVTGQGSSSFTVRIGGEVTLPCEHGIKNQDKCDSTSWVASRNDELGRELVNLGKINTNEISKDKADRLSISSKCSLVVKNVTAEDVGRYTCRQFNELGRQQGEDALVVLSVINMDQHQKGDTVTLFCSVLTNGGCEHTVNWLYEGNESDLEAWQHACSASVTFTTPPLNPTSNYELLKCNVTDNKSGQMLLCDVGLQSSCEKTGSTIGGRNTITSVEAVQGWWWLIIAAGGLAALLITTIVVIGWKKTKGNKTQMDENIGLSLNPAVTQPGPETRQDTADPEYGVAYASLSYTRETNSKAQVCGKDDESDAVTYSTVKASSSPAGASADPGDLYATVNKSNKREAAA